jgi:hypothetical protein
MDLPRFVSVFAEEWKQKMIDDMAKNFPIFNRNLHPFYVFEFYYDKQINVVTAKHLFYRDEGFNDFVGRGSIVIIKFAVVCKNGKYHCHWSHIGQSDDEEYGENHETIYDDGLCFEDMDLYDYEATWFSYPQNAKLIDAKMVYVQHKIKQLQLATIHEFQTNPENYTENVPTKGVDCFAITITDVERVFADSHMIKMICKF